MPVPLLPLEVVDLIAEELASSAKNDGQRRAVGVQVCLVCKAWTDVGLSIVWRKVTVETRKKEQHLLPFLLRRPDILERVRNLTITDVKLASSRTFAYSDDAQDLKVLLHGCRPHSLRLEGLIPILRLLHTAVTTPWADQLRSLVIACHSALEELPLYPAFIACFQHLEHLTLVSTPRRQPWSDSSSSWTARPKLSLKTLVFTLGGEGDILKTLQEAVFSPIDCAGLRKVNLTAQSPGVDMGWLSSCKSLTSLILSGESTAILQELLPPVLSAAASLPFLSDLSLDLSSPFSEEALAPAPIDLPRFLLSLPPNLLVAVVGGLFFRRTWRFPAHEHFIELSKPRRAAQVVIVDEAFYGTDEPMTVKFVSWVGLDRVERWSWEYFSWCVLLPSFFSCAAHSEAPASLHETNRLSFLCDSLE